MNNEELIKTLRVVPDFPRKGIMFFDITTMLKNPDAVEEVTNRLYELYKDIIFGERLPNMAPHHIKSTLFTLHFNDKIKIIDDTIVKLSVQEFYPSVGEVKMTIFGGSFSGYQDEVTLPITVGVKYTLTQKYYRCQPLLNDIKPLIRVEKKRNQLKLYFYDPSKSRWVKMEYKRKCISCYEELKKLLLEE